MRAYRQTPRKHKIVSRCSTILCFLPPKGEKKKEKKEKGEKTPMVETREELVALIAKRDNITVEEAEEAIDEVQEMIDDAIDYGASYEEIALIVQDELGLEPDYMDLFIL